MYPLFLSALVSLSSHTLISLIRYKVIVACSQNLIDDLEVRGFSKPLFVK